MLQWISFGIWAALAALILYAYGVKPLLSRHRPVKRVRAEVIEKHTLEGYAGPFRGEAAVKYVVAFQAEDGKHSFYVSEASYAGYRVHDRGELEYQGDRLIGFH